eukprot:CAMPEP_0172903692 /NCGR_PEP_ID=MMETSP1075-20121228/171118_1 /TAXON_ID=2916 /ORGANISM="Ceratium fusus, Strain PA161109" /LENGTH=102 /DNA_ID=CAMNT_0013760573 /DNA_START=41 /DNA_END=349 /DNA_ORIENTATION=+
MVPEVGAANGGSTSCSHRALPLRLDPGADYVQRFGDRRCDSTCHKPHNCVLGGIQRLAAIHCSTKKAKLLQGCKLHESVGHVQDASGCQADIQPPKTTTTQS